MDPHWIAARLGRLNVTKLDHIPYAQPVQAIEPVRGIPSAPTSPVVAVPYHAGIARQRTDRFAIISAMLGFVGIIPVVCQVIGLVLGAISLARIRRARREGIELAGTKWAATGLVSNSLLLICWIGIFAVMIGLRVTFSHSAQTLHGLLPPH